MLTRLVLVCLAAPWPSTRPYWVFFDHKGAGGALTAADTPLSERALARRAQRRSDPGLIDERDLPVDAASLATLRDSHLHLRTTSRWLNAASVDATPRDVARLRALPFVRSVEPVRCWRSALDAECALPSDAPQGGVAGGTYGLAFDQLAQIDLINLHARGFSGAGIVVGVLDTGFNREHEAFNFPGHPLQVIAEYDFVNGDANAGIEAGDPSAQHEHGTAVLGALAAYKPGEMLGAAFDAAYVLAKTEATGSETPIEEDYYVAGLEFIEAAGADVATSSLLYDDWYTPADFDGATAVTSIAVNIATANGLVCVTAAGNNGHDGNPSTLHLGAPADAFDVITVGAVSLEGSIIGFSSDGPSFDGRVKPEVLALGGDVATVVTSGTSGITTRSGTSMATPLVAGAAACLVQARADFGVAPLRAALMATATDSIAGSAPDPLFIRGFGIVQANAASLHGLQAADLDMNGLVSATDLALLLGAWGSCAVCAADLDGNGIVGASDLAILLGAWTG